MVNRVAGLQSHKWMKNTMYLSKGFPPKHFTYVQVLDFPQYFYISTLASEGVALLLYMQHSQSDPHGVCAYPVVFLEPLSAVDAAFAPPFWRVLRIEVKEPLSERKLRETAEAKDKAWSGDRNGGSYQMWMKT